MLSSGSVTPTEHPMSPDGTDFDLVSTCEPGKITAIFSSFGSEKCSVINSIGFGALMELPPIVSLNNDLSLWLYERFDSEKHCLRLDGGVVLPIRDADVHLVYGIPFQGHPAISSIADNQESILAFHKKLFPGSEQTPLTIPSLEHILISEHASPLNDCDRDAFKIACVLYVATYLLAPAAYVGFPIELIKNFVTRVDPQNINWASLVLSVLGQASLYSRLLKSTGCKKIRLFGCCHFLQVFYLDNLNFGPSSPYHCLLPRAKLYSSALMNQLALSDLVGKSDENLMLFGKTKIRDGTDVCYTRVWKGKEKMASQPQWLSQAAVVNPLTVTGTLSTGEDYDQEVCKLSSKTSECLGSTSIRDLYIQISEPIVPSSMDCLPLGAHDIYPSQANLPSVPGNLPEVAESIDELLSQLNDFFGSDPVSQDVFEGVIDKLATKSDNPLKRSTAIEEHSFDSENIGYSLLDAALCGTPREPLRKRLKSLVSNPMPGKTVSPLPGGTYHIRGVTTADAPSASTMVDSSLLVPPLGGWSINISSLLDGNPMQPGACSSLQQTSADEDVDQFNLNDTVQGGSLDVCGHSSNALSPLSEIFMTNRGVKHHSGSSSSQVSKLVKKIVTSHSNFPVPFFELGYGHPCVIWQNKDVSYKWTTNRCMGREDLKRNWIVFYTPRELAISGYVFRQCLKLNGNFTVEMVDAIMALWRILDEKEYNLREKEKRINHTWRHFLPASFAVSVLGNQDFLNSVEIRESFIGGHIPYDVENCQLIVVPVVLDEESWSIYFWDFKFRTITVMDPVLMDCNRINVQNKHSRIVQKLHAALLACIDNFFFGWEVKDHNWHEVYLAKIHPRRQCRIINSGLYVVYYARAYDGETLRFELRGMGEDTNLALPRGEIAYLFFSCKENRGYKPYELMEKISFLDYDGVNVLN